jgi:hypothetical protein
MILQDYPLLKHYLQVKREQLGWNVNLKILESLESALDWEEEEG